MATIRRTLAELEAAPPSFSPQQRARLKAMKQDEVDAKADAATESPTLTDAALDRAVFARDVREAREKAGLTQPAFAERYHITLSRLRDWERGRYRPDSVAAAYIRAIKHDPKVILRALERSAPAKQQRP